MTRTRGSRQTLTINIALLISSPLQHLNTRQFWGVFLEKVNLSFVQSGVSDVIDKKRLNEFGHGHKSKDKRLFHVAHKLNATVQLPQFGHRSATK